MRSYTVAVATAALLPVPFLMGVCGSKKNVELCIKNLEGRSTLNSVTIRTHAGFPKTAGAEILALTDSSRSVIAAPVEIHEIPDDLDKLKCLKIVLVRSETCN